LALDPVFREEEEIGVAAATICLIGLLDVEGGVDQVIRRVGFRELAKAHGVESVEVSALRRRGLFTQSSGRIKEVRLAETITLKSVQRVGVRRQ
jgi:hypothetical protein